MKLKYIIPVYWTMYAELEIEAESLDQACELAREADLPSEGEYLDGSFDVGREMAEIINEETEGHHE